MKTPRSRSHVKQETVEQASDWFVEFRVGDADAAAREEFNQWLRRSPEHVQAYLEIARAYAELPAMHPEQKIDIDALIAYARSDGNVVSLPTRTSTGAARSAPAVRSGLRMRAMLAASILIAIAGAFAWLHVQRGTYSTDIGEQRSITLTDGSTVDLNARTRIRVRMTERERGVELLEGQALFRVAKDVQRPFIVRSGGTHVLAVGTQFDVYRRKSGTTVTVLEGRVAVMLAEPRSELRAKQDEAPAAGTRAQQRVAPSNEASGTNVPEDLTSSVPRVAAAGEATQTVFLAAGEQVTINSERAPAPKRADVAAATAWTQRRLVFEASPLTHVAEEFNRYTTRPLIVEDAQLEDFHISGVYSSTDPASLLRFLREQPEIRVTETDTEIRISQK